MTCENCGQPLEEQNQFCSRCGRPSPQNPHPRRAGDEPTFIPIRLDDVLEGKWRLEKKIGEGGMGTVYLAKDLQLDRPVAVKILSSSLLNDPEVVARFEREAKVTAGLDHPNIVPVHAVGRHESRPFMVMKKLEGETLSSVLRQKGGLTLDETLALMRQLASGLDYIHSKGFVHRDIKAGNIFVGQDGLATILDFGILRPARGAEALTRTGVVMGTPQYMSPEQAKGAREVDHRADLYALAVVLFECLTGTLPFEAESELQVIQMQAHSPPPDLLERAPWIPRPVAEVVRRALAKRPEDRFPSGAELVAALEVARGAMKPPAPAQGDPLTAPSWRKLGSQPGEPPPDVQLADRPTTPHRAERATPEPVAGATTAAMALAVRPRRVRAAFLAVGMLLLLSMGFYAIFSERTAFVGEKHPQAEADAGLLLAEALAAIEDAGEPDAGEADAGMGQLAEAADAGVSETAIATKTNGDNGKSSVGRTRKRSKVGQLKVVTMHRGETFWAQLLVNGQVVGRTPLELDLPEGRHTVRVERAGFKTEEREIKVASGRQAVLRISLRK
ncbi:MAG: protein kinase [Myxococcales bacterium]|nr:protein kinase [Myxococcales bacterium]